MSTSEGSGTELSTGTSSATSEPVNPTDQSEKSNNSETISEVAPEAEGDERVIDELSEFEDRLIEALKSEFPWMNGPKTTEKAWLRAANGIIVKIGIQPMTVALHVNEEDGEAIVVNAFRLIPREEAAT